MNEQAQLLLLAQNPSTNHRALSSLASQEDEEIQRALVSNPSTPFEILMQLGEKFPALLLENLVFPLLLLEDPTLSTLPVKTLLALVKLPQFPPGLLASAARHQDWEILNAVSANPNTPPKILISILEDSESDDSNSVENNPSLPQEYLKLLQRARARAVGIRRRVDGKLIREESEEPPLLLEEMELLFSRGTQSKLWLARSPGLPLYMMESLIDSENIELKASLASNPSVPTSLLLKLAMDPSVYVYSRVLHRADLPLAAMAHLLASPTPSTRASMAVNPSLPLEFLELLVNDPEPEVRRRVASRKDLPASLWYKLLYDPGTEVRGLLAMNTEDEDLLRQLVGDENAEVRQSAAANPKSPPEFLALLHRAGATQDLSKRAMPDLTLSAKELEALSQSGPFARSLVALHPNTTDELRETLLKQSDTHQWIARSLFTPEETLRRLSCMLNEELRFWVATNQSCPLDVLERLSTDRCAGVRRAVAAHPKTPLATLASLSQDGSIFVRYGLTQNPEAPPALLYMLHFDTSPCVSYWASQKK